MEKVDGENTSIEKNVQNCVNGYDKMFAPLCQRVTCGLQRIRAKGGLKNCTSGSASKHTASLPFYAIQNIGAVGKSQWKKTIVINDTTSNFVAVVGI